MRIAALTALAAGLWLCTLTPASAQQDETPAPAESATPAVDQSAPVSEAVTVPDPAPVDPVAAPPEIVVTSEAPAPATDPAASPEVATAQSAPETPAPVAEPAPQPEVAAVAVAAPEAPASPVIVASPAMPPVATVTTLRHEQLPGMCLSLSGRNGESESQPCDGSAAQSFTLPGATPGLITNGGQCLIPRGQGAYPQLVAVACDGSSEQSWTIAPTGEVRSGANRCLALLGVSSRAGERIYAGECPANLPAHRWRVVAVDPAVLHPVMAMLESTARPGKCLGTDGALGLVDCDGRLGRVFGFDLGAPGQFRIMSSCLASGLVADTLSLGQCWDLPAQKWTLTPAANLANLEGKCITVVAVDGRDVLRTASCLPVPDQQWTVKKTP